MPFFQCHFFSKVLKKSTPIVIHLPSDCEKNEKLKTLYLLHGLSDNCCSWSQNTAISRYADEHHIAVVMPEASTSFYTNMCYGKRYFDYISEEVIEFARTYFPLSELRQDNHIGGNSMGGYGSVKIALTYPERFASVWSLSGLRNIKGVIDGCKTGKMKDLIDMGPRFDLIFGEKDVEDKDDLFRILENSRRYENLPKLYHYCGKNDFLYPSSEVFIEFAREKGLDIHTIYDDGIHDWKFWDIHIQQFMELGIASV
ncbi:alpha/beta hydrolase [Fusibacter ferrireducens]|uniref:Esterase family protein n=1 Tax=Fusibacter ferrireducens TaxID=2785058 RepID=A0ABR9ZYI7_9FIRM|nr:alpha/beta hydrolase family protein [Fusibacter ferrireducens]MBF4695519.1 esterase family protein [Fusibacter ferrireducens]